MHFIISHLRTTQVQTLKFVSKVIDLRKIQAHIEQLLTEEAGIERVRVIEDAPLE